MTPDFGFGVLLSILILLDILDHIVWLAGNVTTGWTFFCRISYLL
jgi:hypothetical protein